MCTSLHLREAPDDREAFPDRVEDDDIGRERVGPPPSEDRVTEHADENGHGKYTIDESHPPLRPENGIVQQPAHASLASRQHEHDTSSDRGPEDAADQHGRMMMGDQRVSRLDEDVDAQGGKSDSDQAERAALSARSSSGQFPQHNDARADLDQAVESESEQRD